MGIGFEVHKVTHTKNKHILPRGQRTLKAYEACYLTPFTSPAPDLLSLGWHTAPPFLAELQGGSWNPSRGLGTYEVQSSYLGKCKCYAGEHGLNRFYFHQWLSAPKAAVLNL